MSTDSSTPSEAPAHDHSGGFNFVPPADDHEIEVDYSWRYVDRLRLHDGEIRRIEDTDGYYGEDETFSCTCGEKFENKAQAKAHLTEAATRAAPAPIAEHPGTLTWKDGSDTGFDGFIEYVPSRTRGAGQIVDGADYLIATARTTYTPPADYAFEDWSPLQSGRLSSRQDDPLFSDQLLARALATLSSGHQYTPSRYTVYFRGHAPLYLEGPDGGIAIAERLPDL